MKGLTKLEQEMWNWGIAQGFSKDRIEQMIISNRIEMREYKDETIIDEVGGMHEGGVGWNPKGFWCGECSSITCKGCVNEFLDME